jgi:dGTPase
MLMLRRWMFTHIYLSPQQKQQAQNVKHLIGSLYRYFVEHPEAMSPSIPEDAEDPERRVVDYIAGMTDRFAMDRYAGLFLPVPYEPGMELPV